MLRAKTISLCLLLTSLPTANLFAELTVEGGLTAVHQQEVAGALSDGSASVDLLVHLPRRTGEWLLYLEGSTKTNEGDIFNVYPEINADAGSAQDRDGSGRVQISELNYRWVLTNQHQLTIGQIDPSAHLDRSRIANDENAHFLGAGFVNNPAIEFPDYAIGLMYRMPRTESTPEITAIVSSSDGLADNPGRSYRELIDISDAGKGVFIGLGARWAIGATRIGVGGWFRSDDHRLIDDPSRNSQNYGAYAVYGWLSDRHGVSLRAGLANSEVSPVAGFLGVAYEGTMKYGAIGVGAGRIFESNKLDGSVSDDTTQIESFFRLPLPLADSHITASLQYLMNSGFDATDAVKDPRALIASVRFHLWFGSP